MTRIPPAPMWSAAYGPTPPPGFVDEPSPRTPDPGRGAAVTVLPVPDPPVIPTDPASKQAVLIGWAASAFPVLLYNLATAFDWVHFTDQQFAAIKAIYGAVTFVVAYWVASNVYSKATVAKIRAGQDVA